MSTFSVLPLPTYLIIGAQKSGTRWLIKNLREHPEVFAAAVELSFFNRNSRFEQGLYEYRAAFEGWNGEPVVGESTPGYMMWHGGNLDRFPARIDESLPGVRLIASLRNPVDRAYSAFLHHMRQGRIPTDADLLEWIRSVDPRNDKLKLISGGWYAASLTQYVERFGERLKILLHDELIDNPVRFYTTVLEHIGASTGFLPENLQEIHHRGIPPKASRYFENGGVYRPLTIEERAELYPYFRDDLARLENLLGWNLGAWRPSL